MKRPSQETTATKPKRLKNATEYKGCISIVRQIATNHSFQKHFQWLSSVTAMPLSPEWLNELAHTLTNEYNQEREKEQGREFADG